MDTDKMMTSQYMDLQLTSTNNFLARDAPTENKLMCAQLEKKKNTVNQRLKEQDLGLNDVHNVLPCSVDAIEQ